MKTFLLGALTFGLVEALILGIIFYFRKRRPRYRPVAVSTVVATFEEEIKEIEEEMDANTNLKSAGRRSTTPVERAKAVTSRLKTYK